MNQSLFTTPVLVFLVATASAADFSYTTKTEITGGSMKSMMGMGGRMGGQQSGPTQTTHYFKGGKMARQSGKTTSVYDLDSETITQINNDKKEYSTITLAEFNDLMGKMGERMAAMRGQKDMPDAQWKATLDLTGATKQVAGVSAKEAVMKLQSESKDSSSAGMGVSNMTMDMWIGQMPGYETVKDFNRKLGMKMAAGGGDINPMIAMQGGSSAMKGFVEAGKKLGEIDGIPLQTVMKMYGGGAMGLSGMRPPPAGGANSGAPNADPQQASRDAARDAALSRLPGGLGGLARRRSQKNASDQPPAQPPAPSANPAPPAAAAADSLFMESTTEVISFSNAPVAAGVFEIPAGYKQVEHPMKRMGGR
jgi:hypothetical protein